MAQMSLTCHRLLLAAVLFAEASNAFVPTSAFGGLSRSISARSTLTRAKRCEATQISLKCDFFLVFGSQDFSCCHCMFPTAALDFEQMDKMCLKLDGYSI